MSTSIPDLERVRFFSGQRLAARDLSALQDRQRELRWLHNRSLHAWGVAAGLDVTGRRGDTSVRVGAGYGTDALGREILLREAVTLPVPATAGGPGGSSVAYYLVARYRPDAGQDVLERRETPCHPSGAVRLGDEPSVEWRGDDQIEDEGGLLVLAKAWVRNCRLARDLSTRERRESRPSPTPYLAAGQTTPGATEWVAWEANGVGLGVQVAVSTAAARFNGAPRYQAQVVGARFLDADPGPLVALGQPGLVAPGRHGFTLQVLLPKLAAVNPPVNPNKLRSPATGPGIVRDHLRWYVVWTGIEG
jgi:hypothetical protein